MRSISSIRINAQNATRFRKYNFGRKKPFSEGFRWYKYKKSTRQSGSGKKKRRSGKFRSLLGFGSVQDLHQSAAAEGDRLASLDVQGLVTGDAVNIGVIGLSLIHI